MGGEGGAEGGTTGGPPMAKTPTGRTRAAEGTAAEGTAAGDEAGDEGGEGATFVPSPRAVPHISQRARSSWFPSKVQQRQTQSPAST